MANAFLRLMQSKPEPMEVLSIVEEYPYEIEADRKRMEAIRKMAEDYDGPTLEEWKEKLKKVDLTDVNVITIDSMSAMEYPTRF